MFGLTPFTEPPITIPYYNSPTYAMFRQEYWNEILSHQECGVNSCSLCRYARMIRDTRSDVPLPPVGASRTDIDRFAKGALEIAGKKMSSLTIGSFIQQVQNAEDLDASSIVDYYGVSSMKNPTSS